MGPINQVHSAKWPYVENNYLNGLQQYSMMWKVDETYYCLLDLPWYNAVWIFKKVLYMSS